MWGTKYWSCISSNYLFLSPIYPSPPLLSPLPQLGPAANDLPQLPTQIKLNRIDPSMLEARRQWMQSYLQALSAKSFLSAHPQIFHEAFIFLSGGSYLRKSTEIGRAVSFAHCCQYVNVMVCVV